MNKGAVRVSRAVAAAWLLVAIGWAGTALAAEGWTRFRGPNGSGIAQAENLPVQWTEKDANWKVALPGTGHSSPVVWACPEQSRGGDRIFMTSGDPKTARRFVLCLKASDGSTLWQREYESKKHEMTEMNSYGTSTPAVDADGVYVYWTTPEEITLLALSHEGKDLWRRNLGPFASEHGGGTSPIVFDNLVIIGNDQEAKSSLIAVDRKTGKTAWEIARKDAGVENKGSYSTPMVYQPEDGPPQIIFTSRSSGITSVDPKAGKVVWEVRDALPGRCVSSPILAGGLIVATCGTSEEGQQVTAVRPPAKGAAAKIAYTVTKSPPYIPTPIAKDDLLFLWGDRGRLVCLRAATGEQVWKERLEAEFCGSPIRVGDRLYCVSRKGEVFVIAAGDKYALLGRNPLGEASFATPAISGGVLYFRTLSHLISIGGRK